MIKFSAASCVFHCSKILVEVQRCNWSFILWNVWNSLKKCTSPTLPARDEIVWLILKFNINSVCVSKSWSVCRSILIVKINWSYTCKISLLHVSKDFSVQLYKFIFAHFMFLYHFIYQGTQWAGAYFRLDELSQEV